MSNPPSPAPLEQAYALALQLYQSGALAETKEACQWIIQADPQHAEALLLLGTCLWSKGAAAQAVSFYDRALAVKPNLTEAHFNRGLALRALGHAVEALASYDSAIALNPRWEDAHFNKANLLLDDLAAPVEALAAFDMAISAQPNFLFAHCNRGNALQELGRFDDALDAYRRAAEISPQYADAYFNEGELLQKLGNNSDARECYRKTLAIQPNHDLALNNLGMIAWLQEETSAALAYFDAAIAAAPSNARAHNNRGVALKALDRLDEAYESYTRAVEIDPRYADAFCNRGQLSQAMLRFDEARRDYHKALSIRPDYPECHWNEALCLLVNGDLPKGWDQYEWRWQLPAHRGLMPAVPAWTGNRSIEGKTVLAWREQGFGDTLQFCRYVSLLAERGARVVLEVQAALVPLLQSLPGVERVIASGSERPVFDEHCPLLSLPRAFNTDLASVPASIPYVACPAAKRAQWAQHLGEKVGGLRIGVAWSGSSTHTGDKWRSIALQMLRPWMAIKGASFYSLQADVREADWQALSDLPIQHFDGALNDFSDTAALIEAMDLVISVDTSVAHLAGAMGKPVWILLPHFPDWRWLLGREDSPWYPTARLFRQERRGDWMPVIDRVSQSLRERLSRN